jgi:outer membrane receptor protein involved in Fe transport
MKKMNILFFLLLLFKLQSFAQQMQIKGQVRSKDDSTFIVGATVATRNGVLTKTDGNGQFTIYVTSVPAALTISNVGYRQRSITVHSADGVVVEMEPLAKMEEPFVVTNSGTRRLTRLIDMPISIENYGASQIRNAPTDYYSLAAYKRGIDITTSSLTFKTISTRGFNGSGSTRVNQLVDGMDNQAPGLNFFVGNFAGLTELDVDNVDILPGASSALYGPGGLNGTILITSKNPFQYQGLDVQLKEGVTNVDKRQRSNPTSFHDFSLRYAKAFRNKFAFKIGLEYIKAVDWLASDSSDYLREGNGGHVIPGTRTTDPNYDGVNVYGDETSVDIYPFLAGMTGNPNMPHMNVSRTGYAERDLIDPDTRNIKLSGALHYKITDKIEAELMGYWTTGNTVYTGNNRFALKNIKIGQYKFELKHPNWFFRTYTTQENAGEAYSATLAAQYLNEGWKRSYDSSDRMGSWYVQYSAAYLQALGQGATEPIAHNMARAFADQGRPTAASESFQQIFDQVRKTPIPNGGLFLEKSQLWATEAQYNISKIKFANVIIGGNWKRYVLNSQGTLFIDQPGAPINFGEVGVYTQATKKLVDRVTLSFSGRYDKNEDFKGHFTPRGTALIEVAKDNNIRLSYQTAYRFPSTQQKYIRLNVGSYEILGGLPWVMDYMEAYKYPVYEMVNGTVPASPYVYKEFKPENMKSFEVGYKGLIAERLFIDVYGYFGKYSDFLVRNNLVQPRSTGVKVYSTVVNSTTQVNTHGYGLGFDYRLPANFTVFVNGYSDVLTNVPEQFVSYYNTPKYRMNAGFGNTGLGKKKVVGFNLLMHWQDSFSSDGDLASGPVDAYSTIDAQVSYQLKKLHSTVKLGGTNVFNDYYKNSYANPEVGGLYYLSLAFHL